MRYLVLGNGFDLAHELRTGYKDFLLYAIQRDKTLYNNFFQNSESKIQYIGLDERDKYLRDKLEHNVWMTYFVILYRDRIIRGENWIDFEMEISYIIEIFDRKAESKLEYISELKDINNKKNNKFLIFYNLYGILHTEGVEDVKKHTYSELISNLSDDLNDVILAFEFYLQNEVEAKQISICSPDIIALGKLDGVLNFNYTTTLQRLYKGFRKVPIHYIHGKVSSEVENNMVLGVNEYWDEEGANTHTDFNIFKKFIQRIMKNTGVDYRKWIYDITNNYTKYSSIRNKTDYKDLGLSEVYIFGHSLDISDKDLLEEFFLNENIVVNIFYKNKVHQANLIAAIIKMISEKIFIKQYQSYPQKIKFIQQKEMILCDEVVSDTNLIYNNSTKL